MKNINIAIVRVLQFVVFLIFMSVVMMYFGTLVLIPLSLVVQVVNLLTAVGLPGVLAVIVALPAVGYLGKIVYQTPQLLSTLLEIGFELAIIGQSRVQDFNDILTAVKGSECEAS